MLKIALSTLGGDIGSSFILAPITRYNALAAAAWRRHNRDLAHAPNSQRMVGMGYLNYVSFDQWQVETGRDSIIEEARVAHTPLLIIEIFLVQRPAKALRGATLHLPFDIARMKGLADILGHAGAQNLDFAGVGSTSTSTRHPAKAGAPIGPA